MRIVVIVSHPTQFEAPFFRAAAQDPCHELLVLYSSTGRLEGVLDPEINRRLHWGIDLLGGYTHVVMPRAGRWRWIRDTLHRTLPDLVVVNGYRAGVDLAAACIARSLRVPVALRADMVLFNSQSRSKRAVKTVWMALMRALFSHFFAVGTLSREYLKHFGVPDRKISIFTYPIDETLFALPEDRRVSERRRWRERLGIPPGAFVVVSVTKFNAREAPTDLLEALIKLNSSEIVGLFIGDGELRGELEQRARMAAGPMHFPGYVPYPDLPGAYAAADLFVHPADNEPWGVSVGEAIAAGLPVIASHRVGAAYDLIVSGKNGYVYDAGNPEALARAVRDVRNGDRKTMREANAVILKRWNHAATWSNVVAAAKAVQAA